MPETLPSMSLQSGVDTPPLSSQSSFDQSDSRETSDASSPNHRTTSRDNDSSINSTPTHSITSSSSTDTPVNLGASNRNGTLQRVEYFDSMESKNSVVSDRSLDTDDSCVEKGLNRSLSGPDCLQRHRTDSDTDSVNSLQFREDDSMTMSTDSGLEVSHPERFVSIIRFHETDASTYPDFSWTESFCVASRALPPSDDDQAADVSLAADCDVAVPSTVTFTTERLVFSRRLTARRCPSG